VALELGAQARVIRPEDRLDVLRVELLRACREADEVGEQHGDDFPLLPGHCPSLSRVCRRDEARDSVGHPQLVASAPGQPVQPAPAHDETAALKSAEHGKAAAAMDMPAQRARMRIADDERQQ
jgi:hypothetical protein